ncbi:MAG: type II toxin-antitoxin system RelE/ParE family toxin [Paraburkholderia sp.]|uniref:type II toxin-antitoxin system RelE/ParE family toxin n=1 Tax=Paraburkholderia sp. TaxID=1926495 RepID=UPI0012219881|nr:type II toxin-antitoxin system RelE/ParE family toxin [Paraburkholderia sp.]TAL95706.1 MAG: type II toxin-antitoxin system RelE/ParE family toxin [Paraburkholderia sp.]
MMRLHWTPEAIEDRAGIYSYIEIDNPVAALALDELFGGRAACLLDHPGLGRPGRVTGTRELVVHPNYIVVYDIVDSQVRVLRVLHAAMQWPLQVDNGSP